MRKPLVFIVEDDLQTRKQLSYIVHSLGYEVVGNASTGKSAITKIQQSKPDVILMDYQLRGEWNGIETTERIEALDWKTATIFVTAHAANINPKDLQNISPDGFLSKPINPEVLRHAIDIAAKRIISDLKIEHLTGLLQMVNQESTLLSQHYEEENPLSFLSDTLIKIRGYISVWTLVIDENRRPLRYTCSAENKSPNKDLRKIITKKKLPDILYSQLDLKNNITIVADNPIGGKEDGLYSKYIIIGLSTKQRSTGLMGIRIPYSMEITEEEIRILKGIGLDVGLYLHNQHLEGEADQQFPQVFQNLPDYCYMVNKAGFIIDVNKAAVKALEYKKAELIGKHVFDLYTDKSKTSAKKAFEKWEKTRRLRNIELSIKTKSGKELRVLLNVDMVKNEEGKFEYAVAIQRDITDRKEVEIALEESEEKFRNIFENMDNGYILSDLDGNIQLVNFSTVKILGYKEENDLIGKNANKILYAYPEEREELVEALSLQGKVNNQELTLKTKEGHRILAECNIHLIRDNAGKATAVEGVFQDITLRREIETSLIESEAQYKSIVNSIPDIVYSYSMNTGGVFYSANVESILGYTQNHLYNNPLLWQGSIHPDHIKMVVEAITAAKKDIPYNLEYKIKKADGSWIWLHDRSFQIENIGKDTILKGIAADITERVQSDQQIRKLSLVVENSPAMVTITNIKGDMEYVNPKFCEITGYSPTELIGKNISILKSGHQDADHYKTLWKTILSGENWHGEFLNKKKDGSVYWDMTNIAPLKDENGQITHFVAIKLDITNQKQNSEALVESERSYRGLFNSSLDAIYIQDKDGLFVDVNDTAVKMYGYPREFFIGKTPEFVSAPGKNDIIKVQKHIEAAFNGKQQAFEFWGIKKDGTIFPKDVQLNKGTYFGEDVIFAFGRDITERKRHEESLRESEEKFRAIFETSKDAIYVLDTSRKIIDINDAGLKLFGIKRSEIAKLDTITFYVDKNQKNEFHTALSEKGFVQNMEIDYEYIDGTLINCLESAVVNKNEKDEVINIYGIIRDITELVEARDATKIALEKAQQADKVKTLFLANMSHEIRTPLNAILGFTELLKDSISGRMDSDESEFFDVISSSGTRLMNTVHEILDISQIEAGVMAAELMEINLKPIIEDCVAENLKPASEKGITIDMVFDIFDATVLADKHYISSSISHLIENAVKYTHEGEITVTLREESGNINVIIRDTGIGISPEYKIKIFDIFSQESEGLSKAYQGLGLGMALTKRYLEMCDVDIVVVSEKGKGTTFILKFEKVISIEKIETSPIKYFTKKEKEIPKFTGGNILVVEDDLSNQSLIGFYLRKNKFSISFADSVSSAVQQLNEKPIHLVLLDLSLKGKQHGLDLVDIMKKSEEWNTIPIVVLSAHVFKSDKKRCLEHGCDDFISKPVKQEVLISTIQKYLDQKK